MCILINNTCINIKESKVLFETRMNDTACILTAAFLAMFTLYRIVKWSVGETVLDKASVHTWNATFGTMSAPEQDYFAQFLKDLIPETQRSTCSCSHCTGSVSATLRFTILYIVPLSASLHMTRISGGCKDASLSITIRRT